MRTILRYLGVLSIGIAAACGDDGSKSGDGGADGGTVAPHIIAGGGIADGPIAGVANVYVIDDLTRQPIRGAAVKVGAVSGTTDATGLFIATGVTGPQTIEATAATYGAAMWIGVDGANATIDLKPAVGPAPVTLSGHVTGLSDLTVGSGHVKVALVTYSQSDVVGDAANNYQTPGSGNACFAVGATDSCAFTLASRTGNLALVAAIIDDDTNGTPDDSSDDTQTLIGWAARTDLTVSGDLSGVDLAIIPGDMLGTVTASFGAPPVALGAPSAFIGLELGASGVMQLPVPVTQAAPSLLVPTLASVGATGYRLTGVAQITDPVQGPDSLVLRRDLPGPTLDAGAWLDPPSGVAVTRTAAQWNAVSGGTVMTVAFTNGDAPLLDITVLDGSTSVVPDPATLPAGSASVSVQAIGAPGLDVGNFGLDADRDKLVQVSGVPLQLTD
ncbi:MAG TPA: hypothetical protein VGM88_18635 [Kofleriaceae bacterium]|jgi:hypothetical protein